MKNYGATKGCSKGTRIDVYLDFLQQNFRNW